MSDRVQSWWAGNPFSHNDAPRSHFDPGPVSPVSAWSPNSDQYLWHCVCDFGWVNPRVTMSRRRTRRSSFRESECRHCVMSALNPAGTAWCRHLTMPTLYATMRDDRRSPTLLSLGSFRWRRRALQRSPRKLLSSVRPSTVSEHNGWRRRQFKCSERLYLIFRSSAVNSTLLDLSAFFIESVEFDR